ncbi:MAG: hypothetical protein M0C28_00340 [Candidatus Moduliflexus flocculans]|nr:hypothetical protein [Candidatus Moduliflexus flocculans]
MSERDRPADKSSPGPSQQRPSRGGAEHAKPATLVLRATSESDPAKAATATMTLAR